MNELLETLYHSPHWIFLILGGGLLIFELLGTGGYSLWSGISAFIVGLLAWFIPISWPILWLLFAAFTLLTAYIWYIWLKKQGKTLSPKGGELNQPEHDLIGTRTVVVQAIINGRGRVKIKDGSWLATSSSDIALGRKVIVTEVNGLILTVESNE